MDGIGRASETVEDDGCLLEQTIETVIERSVRGEKRVQADGFWGVAGVDEALLCRPFG